MAQEAETTNEEAPEATETPVGTREEPTAGEPAEASSEEDLDLARARRKIAKANREAENLRRRLKEFEDAEKTEVERLQERAEAAEKAQAEALERANRNLIRAAVIAEAANQGAVDPDVVVALVDSEAIEVSEDGEVSGQADAVAQLLEAKPFLRRGGSPAGPGGGGVRKSPEPKSLDEQIAEAEREGDHTKAMSLKNQKLAASVFSKA